MVETANEIFDREYTYDAADVLPPSGEALNSNTVIATVLREAGLPMTYPDVTVMTFPGADMFLSFEGDHVLGEGIEAMDYSADPTGIVANLSTSDIGDLQSGQIQDGWGSIDSLIQGNELEDIKGSAYNDTFYGNLTKHDITGFDAYKIAA